jgi:hypothetical protein
MMTYETYISTTTTVSPDSNFREALCALQSQKEKEKEQENKNKTFGRKKHKIVQY